MLTTLLFGTTASGKVKHYGQLIRLAGHAAKGHKQRRCRLAHGAPHSQITTLHQVGYGVLAGKSLHHVTGGLVDHVVDCAATGQKRPQGQRQK